MIARRQLLLTAFAAPVIVRASSLMPVYDFDKWETTSRSYYEEFREFFPVVRPASAPYNMPNHDAVDVRRADHARAERFNRLLWDRRMAPVFRSMGIEYPTAI